MPTATKESPAPLPAPEPASGPTEKQYTPIMLVQGILIGRCSQILPNKLQCWRAGDFVVQDSLPSGKVIYQLCRTHVTLQKLADKLDREKIAAGESIQVPAANELPPATLTLEALERLESMTAEPYAVYPPPIVLSADQLKSSDMIYGTPLAESLTQTTPESQKKALSETPPTKTEPKAEHHLGDIFKHSEKKN